MANSTDRLKKYERLEQRAQRRRAYDLQSEDGQYLDRRERQLGINTMEAPDDYEVRRHLKRQRFAMTGQSSGTGNPLVENIVILSLLVLSIYGLYRLTIYLLSHTA